MTDTNLLPLPEYLYGREASDNERVVTIADAHSHALRNVAHATDTKDAEIERLRAEVERLAEEIDWIKFQPEDDRMFAEIEAAAKASFHRHRTSCRGQVLTRADNYESHLVWATLEWVKRTNGAEQHAERLAEALQWYVDNDDTNDGQDGNEFWIAGRDRARALLREQEVDNV